MVVLIHAPLSCTSTRVHPKRLRRYTRSCFARITHMVWLPLVTHPITPKTKRKEENPRERVKRRKRKEINDLSQEIIDFLSNGKFISRQQKCQGMKTGVDYLFIRCILHKDEFQKRSAKEFNYG